MRKVLIGLAALMLCSGMAIAQSEGNEGHGKAHAAKPRGHASNAGGVKEAVKKMEGELRQSLLKGDPAPSEKYLADDYHSVSGANGKAYTKQESMDMLKSGTLKYSQIEVSNEDVATFAADVAIIHGEADVKYTLDGKDASGKYHFACTWLKRNGKWKVIWFQTTKMM